MAHRWGFMPLLGTLAACAAVGGCHRRAPARAPQAQQVTAPVDASALDVDPAARRRALSTRIDAIGAQLGAFRLEVRTTLHLGRAARDYDQADVYRVARDGDGRLHVTLDTPETQVEAYTAVGGVLVRYDRGSLRHKTPRDTDAAALTDVAVSTLSQALDLLAPVAFGPARAEQVEGRRGWVFKLAAASNNERSSEPPAAAQATLSDKPAAAPSNESPAQPPPATQPTPSDTPPPWHLPIPTPPAWRAQARVTSLDGTLTADADTGIILRADLQGRLEIPTPTPPPTSLTLRLTWRITDIGQVPAITPPRSVPEFRRPIHPRDVLAFFRDQVPLTPPPSAEPAPAPAPADPGADGPADPAPEAGVEETPDAPAGR